MRKALLWGFIGGMVYYAIEGVWHIPYNGGWANVSMLLVGGLCFVLVGGINQMPGFYHMHMRLQALIGALIVLVVEYFAGYIVNIRLGMNVWDYSDMPFNIAGQVCLLYGVLWLLLMPFAVWLEDRLNWVWWKAFGGKEPEYNYTLKQAYRELFTGR